MAAETRDRWHHQKYFVDHFIPRWSSKIFILIRRRVPHMQLWRHNEGTYDVIKIITFPHIQFNDQICNSSSNLINWMKIDNFINMASVDLQNNWLVEFSDLKWKSSSNFKWIRWKLTILEVRPILTFWAYLDLQNNWWLNSVTWNENPLQISSQSDENWQF